VLELALEVAAGIHEVLAGHAGGDAEEIGDLVVIEPLDVVEPEDFAMRGLELRDGGENCGPLIISFGDRRWVGVGGCGFISREHLVPSDAAELDDVVGAIANDSQQPRAELRRVARGVQLTVGEQESILHDVLGVGIRLDDRPRDAIGGGRVAMNELAERGRVAGDRPLDGIRVATFDIAVMLGLSSQGSHVVGITLINDSSRVGSVTALSRAHSLRFAQGDTARSNTGSSEAVCVGGQTTRNRFLEPCMRVAAALFFASLSGVAHGQNEALTRAIAARVDSESFSGVVLVAHRGEPVVELARGMSSRAKSIANTPATRFQLASGDKWFTKIAISQLIAEGRVKLSDTVGRFLPGYPNATVRSKVTVEQLLTHRSGLGAYFNDAYLARREKLRTLEDVVALFDTEEPAFAPGERMRYSNSGYVLLGRIVEVASGTSWYDYVQKRVFDRADMKRTGYLTLEQWPEDKAVGYMVPEGGTQAKENTETIAFRGSSAGGGYSTASDLLRLDNALRRGEIGDTATLGRITGRAAGGRLVIANGGGPGANVEISRLGDYTIIVMANLDPPAATRVMMHVATLLSASK
jgi:CubicO group peptidase (beta-lactamase class C family)